MPDGLLCAASRVNKATMTVRVSVFVMFSMIVTAIVAVIMIVTMFLTVTVAVIVIWDPDLGP